MDNKEREHVINCLQIIVSTAGKSTNDSRQLAKLTHVVANALDDLFKRDGLEPIGILFK